MDDFFCKLNEENYLFVDSDSKLRDRECNPEDLHQNTFFNWVDNANKLTTSITALSKHQRFNKMNQNQRKSNQKNNNRKNTTFQQSSKSTPQHSNKEQRLTHSHQPTKPCYYCGKNGHKHRAADKVWTCPDYLEGKPPCDAWIKYRNEKGFPPEKRIVAAIENSSYNRAIALTSDISYKGKFNWFNSEKTILDLGGCDNLVNSSFVKHHLRLDIQV